jgi:hypothetical protein
MKEYHINIFHSEIDDGYIAETQMDLTRQSNPMAGSIVSILAAVLFCAGASFPAAAASIYNLAGQIDWNGLEARVITPIAPGDYIAKTSLVRYVTPFTDPTRSVDDWTTPISDSISTPHLSSLAAANADTLSLNVSFDNRDCSINTEYFW